MLRIVPKGSKFVRTGLKIDVFNDYFGIIISYGKFYPAKVVYVDKIFALQYINFVKICLNIRQTRSYTTI